MPDFRSTIPSHLGATNCLAILPQLDRNADGRPGKAGRHLTIRPVATGWVTHQRTTFRFYSLPYGMSCTQHKTQAAPAGWQRSARPCLHVYLAHVERPTICLEALDAGWN